MKEGKEVKKELIININYQLNASHDKMLEFEKYSEYEKDKYIEGIKNDVEQFLEKTWNKQFIKSLNVDAFIYDEEKELKFKKSVKALVDGIIEELDIEIENNKEEQ